MRRDLKNDITTAIKPLLSSRTEWVKLEAAKVLLCLFGQWVPETSGDFAMPGKVQAQLGLARKEVYERMEAKRERRKKANRRAYIRRRIKQGTTNKALKCELAELEGKTKPANLAQAQRTESDDIQAMLEYVSRPVSTKPAEPKEKRLPDDYTDVVKHQVTADERDQFRQALLAARNNAPRDVFGAFAEHNPEIWPKYESDLGTWIKQRRQAELDKQRTNDNNT